MSLTPPTPGLRAPRTLLHDSKQVAKVMVHVAPGDVLTVSDDLAAQLAAANSHFVDVEPPSPEDAAAFANLSVLMAGGSLVAGEAEPETKPEPEPEPEAPKAARATKKEKPTA